MLRLAGGGVERSMCNVPSSQELREEAEPRALSLSSEEEEEFARLCLASLLLTKKRIRQSNKQKLLTNHLKGFS